MTPAPQSSHLIKGEGWSVTGTDDLRTPSHMPPRRRMDVRTEADWQELRQRRIAFRDKQRAETLKYWVQRDQKMVAKLKENWATQDAELRRHPNVEGYGRLFDFICDTCNRPYATPRKPRNGQPLRCNPCYRAVRLAKRREEYRRYKEWYPDKEKLRNRARSAKRKTSQNNPPVHTPGKNNQLTNRPGTMRPGVVVWSPENSD